MFYGRVRGWVTKESATFRLCFLPVQPSAREVHVCEVERIHYGIPVRGISMPTAKCGVGIVRLQAKESLDLEDDGDTMPRVGQGSTARTSEGRGRDELPRQASKQCGMVEDRVPCPPLRKDAKFTPKREYPAGVLPTLPNSSLSHPLYSHPIDEILSVL
ncbi:hypothetical protein WUBG_12467 [Wuchereria bancrofti]|uniref:Uncharacterized protein n=1 Tax=Wuchereria bancrofti TaxID=6293 RepID=J9EHY8_WUCBA|nr:hypothetical protein WUBG_12467 [Wuchereria bancrofti]